MKTETNRGNVFEASRAFVSVRDSNRLMLDVMDARTIGEAAPDFEGVEMLTQEDNQHVEYVYRGFTELAAISRNDSDGSLRITLKKP